MSLSMRKINTIIKGCVYPATQDRLTYINAVGDDTDEGVEAEETITKIASLTGKKYRDLKSDADFEALYYGLLYATQWDESLADSMRKSDPLICKRLRKNVQEYTELRHTIFGKNRMETMLENATLVDISTIKANKELVDGLLDKQKSGRSLKP